MSRLMNRASILRRSEPEAPNGWPPITECLIWKTLCHLSGLRLGIVSIRHIEMPI